MNKLPEVKSIYCEMKTGETQVIILPKPIPFPTYYAVKFELQTNNKNYLKIKPVF
jgi:hypothetical protein